LRFDSLIEVNTYFSREDVCFVRKKSLEPQLKNQEGRAVASGKKKLGPAGGLVEIKN